MSVTADMVRGLIVAHDAARPRSQQTTVGPSDLSSPCARQIGYKTLGVETPVANTVNLYAYVGTGLHRQLADALEADNAALGRTRWEVEVPVTVPVADVIVPGSADAYDHDTTTVIDWKSRGASSPGAATRDKHHRQLGWYGLGLILAGRTVTTQAVVYVPRNGTLADIEVDARPFDHDSAEAAIRRYEALLTATGAGQTALGLLPTADDCKFCSWWVPGWPADPATACPGAQATQTTGTHAGGNPTQPNPKGTRP